MEEVSWCGWDIYLSISLSHLLPQTFKARLTRVKATIVMN